MSSTKGKHVSFKQYVVESGNKMSKFNSNVNKFQIWQTGSNKYLTEHILFNHHGTQL